MRTRPGQEAVFWSTELDVRSTLCEQPLRWRLIETAPVRALYSLTGDRLRAIEVIDGRDDCCANHLHNDVHGHGDERVVVFGIVIEALHTVLGGLPTNAVSFLVQRDINAHAVAHSAVVLVLRPDTFKHEGAVLSCVLLPEIPKPVDLCVV